MAISSKDVITLAEWLLAQAQDEATWRAVAGRAYYAAFYACRELHAAICSPLDRRTGVHQQIISDLKNFDCFSLDRQRAVRKIGFALGQVRDIRTRADYYIAEAFDLKDAKLALAQAKQIIDKVDSLPK